MPRRTRILISIVVMALTTIPLMLWIGWPWWFGFLQTSPLLVIMLSKAMETGEGGPDRDFS